MLKAYTNNINLFQNIIFKIGAPFSALAPGAETSSYATERDLPGTTFDNF